MSRLEYFIDEHGNLKSTRNLMIKDVCGKPHKEKSPQNISLEVLLVDSATRIEKPEGIFIHEDCESPQMSKTHKEKSPRNISLEVLLVDSAARVEQPECILLHEDCESPQMAKPHKENFEGYKRGYLEAQIILDEVELHHIEINPAYRRQGLAHQLLTHFIQEVKTKGAIRIFLEVSVKNDPALNLYHKFGFLEIGIRKGYYKDADGSLIDAYQMEKIL